MLKYFKHKPIIFAVALAALAVITSGILMLTRPGGQLPEASQESAPTETMTQTTMVKDDSGVDIATTASSASVVEPSSTTGSAAQTQTTRTSTTKTAAATTTKLKPTTTAATPTSSKSAYTDFQARVIVLVNEERTSRGLNALSGNTQLSGVATTKSQDMANLGYFDHTSPTYGSPFDMMKQFGITYRTAGENIAMGQTTPEQVMNSWMNSEGHRANILNASFTQIGVGIAKNAGGSIYWTQMFIG